MIGTLFNGPTVYRIIKRYGNQKAKWGVRIIDHPVDGLLIQAEVSKQDTHPPDVQFKFSGTMKPLRFMDFSIWLDHARAVAEVARKEMEKLR